MRPSKSQKPGLIQRKKNDSSFFNNRNTAFFDSGSKTSHNPSFFSENSSIPGEVLQAPPVQARLKIGKPNDRYEKEADQVADHVVRKIQRQSLDTRQIHLGSRPGNSLPKVQAKADEEELQRMEEAQQRLDQSLQKKPIFESNADPDEEKAIQKKSSDSGHEAEPGLTQKLSQSKGRGQPLPPHIQSNMESHIGADFNNVRVHNDSNAVQMSQQLNAKAFTHGSDIYFNRGQYNTTNTSGNHLLAHELTHTVQQGASKRIAPKLNGNISSTSPSLQRGWLDDAANWVKKKIQSGLNWAAERLIPGYTLLNVILGKNLITDKPVARSGVNLIEGFLDLTPVIGKILFNELKETKSLGKAGVWVEKQISRFGINFNVIASKLKAMWDDMSVWRGMDYNVGVFKRYFGGLIGRIVAFASVVAEKVKELRFKGALLLVGATKLVEAIERDPKALKRIIDNPKLILKNFMLAIKTGFTQFKDKFFTHFKNALLGWLFGKAAEMGVQMPKKFDIPGLFHLIAQLMGITYPQIRAMVVKEIGPKGEMIVSKMEASVQFVKDLVTKGPIALWEKVQDYLSNLKEMFFGAITKLVLGEIVKVAVTKLVMMLNPAGAIVQLVMTLYRVIKFFIDWWQTIKDVASGIINSITMVALGKIKGASNFVENILAKGMKLVIAFLANIFGLGGIVKKVRDLILKISKPVRDAIRKVVAWLVKKGKSMFGKLVKGGKALGKKVKGAVLKFLGVKQKFTTNTGESHSVYYSKKAGGIKLIVSSTPRSISDFLDFYVNEYSIKPGDKKMKIVTDIRGMIKNEVNPALKKLKKAESTNKTAQVNKIQQDLLNLNVQISGKLKSLMSGNSDVGTIIDSYKLEGLTGTYSSMPKPTSDILTADHQPQAAILVWAASQSYFPKSSNMAKRADNRADKGFAINLYETRHISGRTFGTKGDKTKTSFIDKAKKQTKGKNNQEKRNIVVNLIKAELYKDVSAMEKIARKNKNHKTWNDIKQLNISQKEKDALISLIRTNILKGEAQMKNQDLESLKKP